MPTSPDGAKETYTFRACRKNRPMRGTNTVETQEYNQPRVLPRSNAPSLLLTVAGIVATIALVLPAIPQPLSYHNFADHRSWLGIPNFGDVASNLPFAIIGFWGLLVLFVSHTASFLELRERWPYAVMFAGLILTAVGSGYYHLAPGNARLVWDRIPINITIMALLTAVIAERISIFAALTLFPLLEVVG